METGIPVGIIVVLIVLVVGGFVLISETLRSKLSGKPPSWKRQWIWQPPADDEKQAPHE